MSKKQEERSKLSVLISYNSVKYIIIAFGVLFLILSYLQEDSWYKWIIQVLSAFGTTLLSVGVISLVLEASTIKQYSEDAIKNILDVNYPLDAYSDERLNELNNLIAAKLGNVSSDNIEKSLYKLNNNLISLLDEVYYTDYTANYSFRPDLERKVFHKSVEVHYNLINNYEKDNKVDFNITLGPYKYKLTGINKRFVEFEAFKINDTDLLSDVDKYTEITDEVNEDGEYIYRYAFNYPLQKCKSHKVTLKYKYDLNLNDDYMIYRMMHPCENAQITVTIHEKDWKLQGTAFTAFYYKQDNEHGFKVEQKRKDTINMYLNDWCIPGAGFMVKLNQEK